MYNLSFLDLDINYKIKREIQYIYLLINLVESIQSAHYFLLDNLENKKSLFFFFLVRLSRIEELNKSTFHLDSTCNVLQVDTESLQ